MRASGVNGAIGMTSPGDREAEGRTRRGCEQRLPVQGDEARRERMEQDGGTGGRGRLQILYILAIYFVYIALRVGTL